jgi:hypothetical protein
MTERTADELEVAEEVREQAVADGLASVRARLIEKHPDFDGKHCIEPDCGDELPPVRIAYGRIRCTPCQCEVERKEKLGRRG